MKKRDREYTLGHVFVAPSSLSPNGLQAPLAVKGPANHSEDVRL
jgi:hypothetical protein